MGAKLAERSLPSADCFPCRVPAPAVVAANRRARGTSGLVRDRLLRTLDGVWGKGLALVVAPAGSGKTTLLAQYVLRAAPTPVAWYQAESSEGDPARLLAQLHRAVDAALGTATPPWTSVEAAAEALHACSSQRVLVVIDDFHTLVSTPAEAVVERLVRYLPQSVAIVIGSRGVPRFNLARLRLADAVVEVGHNDLRFRTWEAEDLFNHHYRDRLSPEQLAELTRRTEGWAAGLQFFHLAARTKPPAEKARLLAGLTGRSAVLREYLARDVVADLPAELRDFMVRTSPLGWLSGAICDAFLGSRGSQAFLEDAERKQVFTERAELDAYRYHEVFRSYLEAALSEAIGERRAGSEHRRAGALLEDAGRPVEALRAYCRGEDWPAVARLAGMSGEHGGTELLAGGTVLPAALADEPWALLSQARALVRAGRLRAAIDRYQQAERAFGFARGADTCARERVAAAVWADPMAAPGAGWDGALRRATIRFPLASAGGGDHPGDAVSRLAAGTALLLGGHVLAARSELDAVAGAADASSLVAAGARLGAELATLLAGEPVDDVSLGWAADLLEHESDWLARLGWALALAGTEAAAGEAASVRAATAASGNWWGQAVAGLLQAVLWASRSTADAAGAAGIVAAARGAACTFHSLGAPVLEAWAEALGALALARDGQPHAAGAAVRAERAAAAAGTDLARHCALAALVEIEPAGSARIELDALGRTHGLAVLGRTAGSPGGPPGLTPAPLRVAPPVEVTCLGGLAVAVGGRRVDPGAAKPRVRSLLRLLAMHAGRTLHREGIIEALWPEQDPSGATRSLQVAVSALRQLLEPGVPRGGSGLVMRDGDGYVLALPPGSRADVVSFGAAVADGRAALRRGERPGAAAAFALALECYGGDLLPEAGAAEWVVKERHRLQMEAAEAASSLAGCLLAEGDQVGAMRALETGVGIDRYQDGAWRQLIATARAAGDHAAASRARRSYEAMLAELDVIPPADDRHGAGGRR